MTPERAISRHRLLHRDAYPLGDRIPWPTPIFDGLNNWRHVPAYRVERRADTFFTFFLPELLEEKFNLQIEGLVPEVHVQPNHGGGEKTVIDRHAVPNTVEPHRDGSSRRFATGLREWPDVRVGGLAGR